MEEQYRVFISYAHEEKEYARKIRDVLESNNVLPLCDEHIIRGLPFGDEIRRLISHAHVFLPVISPGASARGWVHQEIGYALALNIPVLPVTVGGFAGEMLQELNVVKFTEHMKVLKERLSPNSLGDLISAKQNPLLALYQCAKEPDDRAQMFAAFANDLSQRHFYGMVRQKGGLSSFHIPNRSHGHRIWRTRYGGVQVSQYHCKYLRQERNALETHVAKAGCRLVIDPTQTYEKYGPAARIARLKVLLQFLESMPSDKIQVAIDSEMHLEESLTIVGDWFLAESVSALKGEGYRQTNFTRHAPSILRRVEAFDEDFEHLLDDLDWKAGSSRDSAILELHDIIDEIKTKPVAEANAAARSN